MDRLIRLATRLHQAPLWLRYGGATAMVLLCLGARLGLVGWLPGLPFLPFFLPVLVAAVLLGPGPSLYAAFLGSIVAIGFFIGPIASFQLPRRDVAALLVFLGLAVLTALLFDQLFVTMRRLAAERDSFANENASLSRALQARDTLLSEAVHRARNDLQQLVSIFQMQAGLSKEPACRQALIEGAARIGALARVNAQLDQHRQAGHADIDGQQFIEGLAEEMRRVVVGLRPIHLLTHAEAYVIPQERAAPMGIIINELVHNALKYAFPEEAEGTITVTYAVVESAVQLTVEDDGVGMDATRPAQGSGVGTRIIRALTAQCGGQLDVTPTRVNPHRPGLRWILRIPL